MILLFPGSFKPFHDGHFSLIKRYIEELSPEKVYIIISSKKRAGIPASASKNFIKKVFDGIWDDIEFDIKVTPKKINPINYCYKIIGNDKEENQYAMINSDKDSDNRVADFYELFKKGGDYYHDGAYAVDPEIETEPIYYSDRNDEFSDSPISSAIVRNDIVNDDFESFKLSYNNILNETSVSIEDLEDYFEDLSEDIEQTEEDIDKLTGYLKESISGLNKALIDWDTDLMVKDTGIIKADNLKNKIILPPLDNGGWKKLTIDMVDPEFADVNVNKMIKERRTTKHFYNKAGEPTNWFAWWMILCIYGPMTRKELLRYCDLPEGSYPKTWTDMSRDGIIYYDPIRRKSCPIPISRWHIWF